jgi:hypothetical protein
MNMKKYSVLEATKGKDGIITHKVDTGYGDPKLFRYVRVWAGLQWPKGPTPAYYIILGLEHQERDYLGGKKRRGPLRFFAEFEAPSVLSLNDFFKQLTDDISKYYCTRVFTHTEDEYESFVQSYEDYLRDKELKSAYPDEAPYSENFNWGLAQINDWMSRGKLELPNDSEVRAQLKSISEEDLGEAPETKFLRINALRYLLGGFLKYAPEPVPDWIFRGGRRKLGWMAR